jgi:hypothetical protein
MLMCSLGAGNREDYSLAQAHEQTRFRNGETRFAEISKPADGSWKCGELLGEYAYINSSDCHVYSRVRNQSLNIKVVTMLFELNVCNVVNILL